MKQPNFFIVGAPKCGTTSLWRYLNEHPNCFMSPVKEPKFFSPDIKSYKRISRREEYLKLFEDATANHIAVGEASPNYIYSGEAIQNIYNFNRNAKIIAVFRNPVDLVYSYHWHLVRNANEKNQDFEKVWNLMKSRTNGHDIPDSQIPHIYWDYSRIAKHGNHAENILAIFPREQVKLILFDDFIKNTESVYEEILDFLNLPQNIKNQDFKQHNPYRKFRSPRFNKLCLSIIRVAGPFTMRFKRLLRIERVGIMDGLRRINKSNEIKKPLSPEMRSTLVEEFREDTQKLSLIINRDLSHWMR